MKKFLQPIYVLIITLLFTTILFAQDKFVRIDSILVPEEENCGFGEIIAGVDFDGDGLVEIYAVNNMHDEPENVYIPRIYKYEKVENEWKLVWHEYSRDIPLQNSWAGLTYGDWDNDNKQEIIWSPSNYFDETNTNPPRILDWEANGNDILGKKNFGFQTPSAQSTITDHDNFDLRPFRLILNDIDRDGTKELIFCDRAAEPSYGFGVISVTSIPDNGNGSEVWTMKASGLGSEIHQSAIWDMAILNSSIYLFHEDGYVTHAKYENGSFSILNSLPDVFPGGSWKSANVVDLDKDGTEEIIISGWQADSSRTQNKVFLMQEDGNGSLTRIPIADFGKLITKSGRLNGGHDAVGDIDNDGHLDFIFGTRDSDPVTAILRMEYNGGDIADSNSYDISIIDSLYPNPNPARYDIVALANLDDDPELEVLYTDGNLCGKFPIVILDLESSGSTNISENKIPNKFSLEQNYPNPFNPTTNIVFSLPKQSNVDLRVFNSLGEQCAVIVNSTTMQSGTHSYKFNASNLASGVYVYTLKTDFGSVSKKMTIIK
jgi:hypothetical protein